VSDIQLQRGPLIWERYFKQTARLILDSCIYCVHVWPLFAVELRYITYE